VRYDAAWTIWDAGYDGEDIRAALAQLAGETKLPEDELLLKKSSNAELSARVEARQALDALLAKS
jgi:hypothetical protein